MSEQQPQQPPGGPQQPSTPPSPALSRPGEAGTAPPPYGGRYAGTPPPAAQPRSAPDRPVGPSASGRKAGLILAIGGGVVLVAAVAVLALAFLGNRGGTDSPEGAVTAFTAAVSDGNCDKATQLLTDKLKASAPCDLFGSVPFDQVQLSFTNIAVTDQTGTAATVTADASAFGQTLPVTFRVLRQGQRWLIDDVVAAGIR